MGLHVARRAIDAALLIDPGPCPRPELARFDRRLSAEILALAGEEPCEQSRTPIGWLSQAMTDLFYLQPVARELSAATDLPVIARAEARELLLRVAAAIATVTRAPARSSTPRLLSQAHADAHSFVERLELYELGSAGLYPARPTHYARGVERLFGLLSREVWMLDTGLVRDDGIASRPLESTLALLHLIELERSALDLFAISKRS